MAAERAHTDDRLRGQLEWLADEIDAQRPFIRQLPEPQLTAAPLEGEPSIRGLYERLLKPPGIVIYPRSRIWLIARWIRGRRRRILRR